jgi:hypothetical protein
LLEVPRNHLVFLLSLDGFQFGSEAGTRTIRPYHTTKIVVPLLFKTVQRTIQ